jgi:hypothetical protein
LTKLEKKLKTLIGKIVIVHWRDPSSISGWASESTEMPPEAISVAASTIGWFVGTNDLGELVIAGTIGEGNPCDLSVIPAGVLESVDEITI